MTIDKFLGLNMNESNTELKLGESGRMKNFRITDNYKLDKMYGYSTLYGTAGDKPVRAQIKVKFGSTIKHIYVCGGKVYSDGTEVGTVTDGTTSMFEFNGKVYILTGTEYKSYDGTTLADVVGYIPLVKVATTPAGSGTDLEPINVLTGKKRQLFSPDGTATVFQLTEKAVTSIDSVKVNGVETTVTKDLTAGTITFGTAPIAEVNAIEVQWTKGTGNRDRVIQNTYAITYGIATDTRVFLWGNTNKVVFSALASGIPSVEYFPDGNHFDIGSSNVAVTDINRAYDRLIIHTEKDTYYTYYDSFTDANGDMVVNFPVMPLNSAHGMIAPNQGQVLNNNIITIDTSLVEWVSTQTKDERNAVVISQRIQKWLNEKDLSKAITCDYQPLKEYWLAIDNEIMIYNYGNSTFYLLELPDNVSSLYADENVYVGTTIGQVMKFDKEEVTYNGNVIDAYWEMGYFAFSDESKRKTIRTEWITIQPYSRTSVDINYVTDVDTGEEPQTISLYNLDYGAINYENWSYDTNYTVRPFRIKMKAKKFAFLKITLENKEPDEKLTINAITAPASYGGNVK